MKYNPSNWYWIVINTGTQVWSSAVLKYIDPSNTVYRAWLADGGFTTQIDSVESLLEVQQTHVLPTIIAKGLTISSNSNPSLNATYALDDASSSRITSVALGIAAGRPLPSQANTFNYADINGQPHAFTGPQFLDFAAACEGYIYDYNQALALNLSGTNTAYPANATIIP